MAWRNSTRFQPQWCFLNNVSWPHVRASPVFLTSSQLTILTKAIESEYVFQESPWTWQKRILTLDTKVCLNPMWGNHKRERTPWKSMEMRIPSSSLIMNFSGWIEEKKLKEIRRTNLPVFILMDKKGTWFLTF